MDALTRAALTEIRVSFECRSDPRLVSIRDIRSPYSAVRRIEVDCDGSQRIIYLKQVRPDAGREVAKQRVLVEHDILTTLYQRFRNHGRFRVARPLGVFPEHGAIITEEVPGTELMAMIGSCLKRYKLGLRQDQLERYCFMAGEWLREFQALTARDPSPFDTQALLRYCDTRLDSLMADPSSGVNQAFKQAFAAYLQRKCEETGDQPHAVVGRHNDFSPHNMLVDDGRLGIIDFGFFDYESPIYDVCRFWFHLEWMKSSPLFRPSAICGLQQSFIDGYGNLADARSPAFEMVASRYIVTRLATMSNGGIRSGARGWIDRRSYRWGLRWMTDRLSRDRDAIGSAS